MSFKDAECYIVRLYMGCVGVSVSFVEQLTNHHPPNPTHTPLSSQPEVTFNPELNDNTVDYIASVGLIN